MAMISREDLLKALQDYHHGQDHEDALTSHELCEVLNLGIGATRKRIRSLVKSGVLEPVWTTRVTIAGVKTKVPAYKLSENEGDG